MRALSRNWRHWIVVLGVLVAGPALALGGSSAASPPPGYPGTAAPPPTLQPARPRWVLTGVGGWATSSDVDAHSATLQLGDASSWGASVGIQIPHGLLAEFKWIYMNPEAKLLGLGGQDKFHVPTNYFLLSGEKGIRRDRLEPFLYGALGTVVYSPGSFTLGGAHYSPGTSWRLAFGLGGGLKVFLTERLGVRFAAEMLAPLFIDSASFYVGTGGSGMGVSAGIPTVSGNFTIGVVFTP